MHFKDSCSRLRCRTDGVSIPSERESAFQVMNRIPKAELFQGFQFPPSGKVHFKFLSLAFSGFRCVGFNSLRAGKCISRHPFFDPDEPWLQIPQNHTRPARRIFFAKIYPTTPRNPDEYWNGRDFLSKVPHKSGVACVLGQF